MPFFFFKKKRLNSAWLPTHPLLSDLFFIKWASAEEDQLQHADTLTISKREVDCFHPEGLSEDSVEKGDSLKFLSIFNLHIFVSHKYTHDKSSLLLCCVLETKYSPFQQSYRK